MTQSSIVLPQFLPFLLLSLLFCCSHVGSMSCPPSIIPWTKRHVTVVNDVMDIKGGNVSIIVHCKSKNIDVGQRNLAPKESFTWSFRSNMWTTLFWCNAWWENVIAEFQPYDCMRDDSECKNCLWSIRYDGGYYYDACKHQFKNLYKWRNATASLHP